MPPPPTPIQRQGRGRQQAQKKEHRTEHPPAAAAAEAWETPGFLFCFFQILLFLQWELETKEKDTGIYKLGLLL